MPRLEWPQGWRHELEREPELSSGQPWAYSEIAASASMPRMERFELRHGDVGTSKRNPPRERSEKRQAESLGAPAPVPPEDLRQYEGDEYWYAWSFCVPADWQDSGDREGSSRQVTMSQFLQVPEPMRPEDWEPAFLFGKRANGPFRVLAFSLPASRAKLPPASFQLVCPLISHADFAGRWHDIKVHAVWTPSAQGCFDVWVGSERRMTYRGPTMTAGNSQVFHKYGLYRASMEGGAPRAVAYFSGLVRGRTEADVS